MTKMQTEQDVKFAPLPHPDSALASGRERVLGTSAKHDWLARDPSTSPMVSGLAFCRVRSYVVRFLQVLENVYQAPEFQANDG
jgi:hypothetical protein